MRQRRIDQEASDDSGTHSERGWRARLVSGLPVKERMLSINGVATSVLEGGQGPSVVLVHGGIECGGVYWAPIVSQLLRRHHVVIPDVPGLGASQPVARLTATTFAEWFAALLRLTCQGKPFLVAHSLPATLVALFAADHGDRLDRLVLYGTPGIGRYRMPVDLRIAAIRFAVRPSERNAERFERLAFADLDSARRQDPEWFAAFSAYLRSRARVRHVKRTMRQLIGTCTKQVPDEVLQRIAIPTALIWATQDRFVPLELAQEASIRLGWPLHVIDDAGHATHIERPDAFLGALAAFETS